MTLVTLVLVGRTEDTYRDDVVILVLAVLVVLVGRREEDSCIWQVRSTVLRSLVDERELRDGERLTLSTPLLGGVPEGLGEPVIVSTPI